jgi:DNA-binding NarL/FixJ family response regulator
MADDRIRILIADAQPLFAEAVKAVLEGREDLHVVGLARDGTQAVALADEVRPDVALLDLDLPNCDGIRVTQMIMRSLPECGVVILAEAQDDSILVDAIEAGASGYLTRGAPLTDLIEAARTVHRGGMLVPDEMLRGLIRSLLSRRREQQEAAHAAALLTRREKEVLALLAEGSDNNHIAQVLVISPQTVRTHIQNLLAKLGAHSRLEAAAFVMRNGLHRELEVVRR